jgi:hypothetical protein
MRLLVTATCSNAAAECLARVREVADVLESFRVGVWPPIDVWTHTLPAWFVDACAPPLAEIDAMIRIEEWVRMSRDDQLRAAATRQWALADWLYWQQPMHAVWEFLDGRVVSADTVEITLAIGAWPTSLGSFEWLAHCAGTESLTFQPYG